MNHRQILNLAIPMIISNVTTPLLGLVDTGVLGHLDSPRFLGGVALGGLIFNFLYWGFGFLRMGTTGVTAQAYGRRRQHEMRAVLARSLLISLAISMLILLCQYPVRQVSFWFLESSWQIEQLAVVYFDIRIWSAPATLANFVVLGWFIGIQDVKKPLLIVLVSNLCNIVLDIFFVVELQMGIEGVALASVIAEYVGLLTGTLLLIRQWQRMSGAWNWSELCQVKKLVALLVINNNIFIRTLCLILVFAFFTAQGAKLGEAVLAANAVLLNFQMFMAFALDGIAHATEALLGRAIGAADSALFKETALTATLWSGLIAVGFSCAYALTGTNIIALLTNLQVVIVTAGYYLPWVIFLPLASFASFLLDGIFIGATWTREMRNTMLFATLCGFLPVWYFTRFMHNHGLWLALTVFMLARGGAMAWVYRKKRIRLA